MAGEYDERFDKLEALIQKAMGSSDVMRLEMRDLRSELRDHSFRFDKIDARFDKVDAGLNRQTDVIPKVIEIQKTVNRISDTQAEQTFKIIEMLNRLTVVEIQLKSLEERAIQIESEVKEIRGSIHSLIDPVLTGSDLRSNLDDIERRVAEIEEKLTA